MQTFTKIEKGAGDRFYVELYYTRSDGKNVMLECSKGYKTRKGAEKAAERMS